MKYIIQIDDSSSIARSVLSVIKNSKAISVKSKTALEKELSG